MGSSTGQTGPGLCFTRGSALTARWKRFISSYQTFPSASARDVRLGGHCTHGWSPGTSSHLCTGSLLYSVPQLFRKCVWCSKRIYSVYKERERLECWMNIYILGLCSQLRHKNLKASLRCMLWSEICIVETVTNEKQYWKRICSQHALMFSFFFIYHTRCGLFGCFDSFSTGAKKHTHSLWAPWNERKAHTDTHARTRVRLCGIILSPGVFILRHSGHSFVIFAVQASGARLSFQKSPLCTLCVFEYCMLQYISGYALTAWMFCNRNTMMWQW